MENILLNALGLILIIATGYTIKRIGLVKTKDGRVLSSIIMNVTLPAAIVIGLNSIVINSDFLLLAFIGIIMNVILISIAGILWRRKKRLDQILFMNCVSGYNIGNFTLPFIQSFYPTAVPFLFMFDVGNCIMLAGVTNIMIESFIRPATSKISFRPLINHLFHSMPFLTYITMFFLRLFNLSVPGKAITILESFSKANGFLSLLMIGIYLELALPKKEIKNITKILSWRYLFACIFAGIFYFVLPFKNPVVRATLVLISFAPIPTFAVINSVLAGVKEETAGFITSVSIIISLVVMTCLTLFLT